MRYVIVVRHTDPLARTASITAEIFKQYRGHLWGPSIGWIKDGPNVERQYVRFPGAGYRWPT